MATRLQKTSHLCAVAAVCTRTSGAGRWFSQTRFGCVEMYGSQRGLNQGRRVGSKGDLTGVGGQYYAQSDIVQGGGNGYDPFMDGYTYTITKSSGSGKAGGMMNAQGMRYSMNSSALCWLSRCLSLRTKWIFWCPLLKEYA